MVNVRITTQGLNELERRVNELSASLLSEFDFEELVPAIVDTIDRIFDTQGNGTWQPLTPEYQRWKEREFPGRDILELTLDYRRAATTPGGANNILEVGEDSLVYGVDEGVPYASYHEFGTRNIPARPVFELAAEDNDLQQEIVRIVSDYLDNLEL